MTTNPTAPQDGGEKLVERLKDRDIQDRFWAKTKKVGECLVWMGYRYPTGYGAFSVDNKNHRAHRIAWQIRNGRPFPRDMDACHSCDTRSCVNPDHTWPGTRSQNMADCANKRRHHMGRRSHCKNGHPFVGRNVLWKGQTRSCRACATEYRNKHLAIRALQQKGPSNG